jgi:hypothetical protein
MGDMADTPSQRAEKRQRALRQYSPTRELLEVRRLELDAERRLHELTLRLRGFEAREAAVIVKLRAAGFLRRRDPA